MDGVDKETSDTAILRGDLPFPAELFEVIAEFLGGEHKLRSLASLNVANRFLHEATSAALWTTITLDAYTPKWNDMLNFVGSEEEDAEKQAVERFERCKDLPGVLPENRRRVKFLFLTHGCDIDDIFVRPLFPNLKIRIETLSIGRGNPVLQRAPAGDVNITIYQPVSTSCLFIHLLHTPMRRRMMPPDKPDLPQQLRDQIRNACLNDYLPVPLPLSYLILSDTGTLRDDFSLEFEEPSLVAASGQPPPFHKSLYPGKIVLKHEGTDLEGSCNISASVKPIVDSLFELLKVAAWSDAVWESGLEKAGDDIDHQLPEFFEGPSIAVYLRNKDLKHLVKRFPYFAQKDPNVLRCRLLIVLVDESSNEDLFNAIKVFQSTYAIQFALISVTDDNIVVEITAERSSNDLRATLKAEWEEYGDDPVALHVEVKAERRRGEDPVMHRSTIELPTTTDAT